MTNEAVFLPLAGLIAGLVLGYVARHRFFCTLSALESHWYGGNSNGLRTWVLAAVVAAISTQLMIHTGLVEVSRSFYLVSQFNWFAAILGGIAFGLGMALVGTCGLGALVRLGGGSLKSLIALIILALAALSTQRGILGLTREGFLESINVDFFQAGSQALPDIAATYVGAFWFWPTLILAIAIPAIWVFADANYRRERTEIETAGIIGLIIAFGWFATAWLAEKAFFPVQVESASFVSPVADTLLQFALFTGQGPDFGIGMVLGVVGGAALAARRDDNVRWEACDDARELSRHIAGAALMGFGGTLALGCTIGQGISAASLLTISAPIVFLSIAFGARLGLAWLLEGSFRAAFLR